METQSSTTNVTGPTRCTTAISLGWYPEVASSPSETKGLHTRCMLEADDHTRHIGRGLPQFDYQRWEWFTGDRRTYTTDRADDAAWKLP